MKLIFFSLKLSWYSHNSCDFGAFLSYLTAEKGKFSGKSKKMIGGLRQKTLGWRHAGWAPGGRPTSFHTYMPWSHKRLSMITQIRVSWSDKSPFFINGVSHWILNIDERQGWTMLDNTVTSHSYSNLSSGAHRFNTVPTFHLWPKDRFSLWSYFIANKGFSFCIIPLTFCKLILYYVFVLYLYLLFVSLSPSLLLSHPYDNPPSVPPPQSCKLCHRQSSLVTYLAGQDPIDQQTTKLTSRPGGVGTGADKCGMILAQCLVSPRLMNSWPLCFLRAAPHHP